MNNSLSWLTQEIDFILAERNLTEVAGPHFRIYHQGPDITSICLVHTVREFRLPLAPGSALLFGDFTYHRLPRCAGLIAQHMNNTLSRSSIKVYVNRIRRSLGFVFKEAGLHLDPCKVLASEMTDTNVVAYRLRGTFEWM